MLPSSQSGVGRCTWKSMARTPSSYGGREPGAAGMGDGAGENDAWPGRPGRWSVLVDDDAADVAAGHHVLVAPVDLVEPVCGGDELVQLELAGPVQLDHPRDDVERV